MGCNRNDWKVTAIVDDQVIVFQATRESNEKVTQYQTYNPALAKTTTFEKEKRVKARSMSPKSSEKQKKDACRLF